jgi:hypothetical protein
MVPPTPIPFVPPTGKVFFPLASNAHALVTGGPIASVRARLKVSSLLYENVLVEAGQMSIQAGPNGAQSWRRSNRPDSVAAWQTPMGRKRGQAVPFTLAMARETTPGVPAPGPYHTVLHSKTSICWMPTFEPFKQELPSACDWIIFGNPSDLSEDFGKLADNWKRSDDRNGALKRLVPESFVRSHLVDHISKDMAVGAAGGWDVSVDRMHGGVIAARFVGDAAVQIRGVALPIVVPHVGDLGWDDVVRIRRLKAIQRLRDVLREIEAEAFEVANSGGDLEDAMRKVFVQKLSAASSGVQGVRNIAATSVAELVVGAGAGYATTGLALLGPVAGAGITATFMAGLHVRRVVRDRRQCAWVGVMEAISNAVP